MKVTLGAVFLGIFIGALGYEIVQRTNPNAVNKIRNRASEAVNKLMGSDDIEDTMEAEEI